MYTLMKFICALFITLPLHAAYKGGKPAKLADEMAERLEGCQENMLRAYQAACQNQARIELLTHILIDENQESLFGNDAQKAQEYQAIMKKINALIAQQLEQKYEQDLKKCLAKNAALAKPTQAS